MMIKAKFKVVICWYSGCYGFLMIRTSAEPKENKSLMIDIY